MVAERVGDRVRKLRRAKKWSQQQLAAAMGTDKSYIGRLEAGIIVEPGVDVQERLAEALGVDIREVADPRLYKGVGGLPSWEAALRADPRFNEEDKAALLRAGRAMILAGDKSDQEAAS